MRTLRPCLVTLALIATTACALHDARGGTDTDLDSNWTSDWNARIDASPGRNEHPCGDFVFDAWAQTFLWGCELGSNSALDLAPDAKCGQRLAWVWARSRQCDVWQEYLLRNHFQHVRRDDIPEPDMHLK